MTEYFRITGLNLIPFDALVTLDPDLRYTLAGSPKGIDEPLTRQEVVSVVPRLPEEVRSHALNRGLSRITFPFTIKGATDADMEDARHDLTETLVDGKLFIETQGVRGTQAVLQMKSNNAVQQSYKTIVYGEAEESAGREVLGGSIKQSFILNMQMTLYCEPRWRPETRTTLGPNEIYCPGLEEDGDANGRADDWAVLNVPTLTMESTIVLQGFYSQKVVTRNIVGDGIRSTIITAPAGVTDAVCYAWICRPAGAPSDIRVQMYEEGVGEEASALFDTGGWETETAKDGINTFHRVEVFATTIVPAATYSLRIFNTQATATTLYVDKVYWKWDETVIPDEWCDHWLAYGHYDTTEGAAHEGHINYFDVADLKGTDQARLLLRVEFEQIADEAAAADVLIARRSWWDNPSPPGVRTGDVHWLEAENASAFTNWAAVGGVPRCSAGDCISNGANASGEATWAFVVAPPAIGQRGIDYFRGRHDVFGMVYTDDPVNTQYRLSYSNFSNLVDFYNPWVKQPLASLWQIVYLGEINWDKYLRDNQDASNAMLHVEYQKDAADTVSLDCLWLLRKTEPETRLVTLDGDWQLPNYYWVMDRTEDFDYEEKEYIPVATYTTRGELCLQGDVMTLSPNKVVGERLYFGIETVDTTPAPDARIWEAHGAATDVQLRINLDYLAQYQSPLD